MFVEDEAGSSCVTVGTDSSERPRRMLGSKLSIFGEAGLSSIRNPTFSLWATGGLVTVGWGGKFVKARSGDMGFVCSLMGGPAGVGEEEFDGVGDWGRSSKEEVVMSSDGLAISTVGDNKDNLAKCIDGEETAAGDGEADVFFVFFDLRRGGTGGGGMIADAGTE